MTSHMVQIRQRECGRVAILDLTGPLTQHAHSGNHLLFWIGGDFTSIRVDKSIVPLDDHQAVAINSWEPHGVGGHDHSNRSLYLLFYIDPDWAINRTINLGLPSSFESPSFTMTRQLSVMVRQFAERLMRSECELNIDEQIAAIFDGSVLAMQQSCSKNSEFVRPKYYTDFRVRKAVDYMQDHLDVRVSFDDVARVSGLSRPHFFYLFRKQMNITPSVFWNTLRMESAIDTLIQTNTSLTDLSYELGFSEPGNFSRFFRSHSGVCPSQYRQVCG